MQRIYCVQCILISREYYRIKGAPKVTKINNPPSHQN